MRQIRKFKEDDIIRHKYGKSQPYQVICWDKVLRQYKTFDLVLRYIVYASPELYEIYPRTEYEEYLIKKEAEEKYNL